MEDNTKVIPVRDLPVSKTGTSRAVVEALRTHGCMGRKQIAGITNLSVATVWRAVNDLIEGGIVADVAPSRSGNARGRNTTLVDIASSGGWVIALDLGSSHVKAAAMDMAGHIHDTVEHDMGGLLGDLAFAAAIRRVIAGLLDICVPVRGMPQAVGFGSAGAVDRENGVVTISLNQQLENFPVAKIVREILDVPVVGSYSCAVSAYAEAKCGRGRSHPNFAYIAIGVGIGAVYILNRQIYVNPSRAEIAHMVVAKKGDPKRFGGRGCLESFASGSGIAASARMGIESGKKTFISDLAPGGPATITAKIVAEAAQQGDELAIAIMSSAADYLGMSIVNIANTIGLRYFVIDGGVSRSGDVFWKPLQEAVDEYEYYSNDIQLVTSRVDGDSTILGAGLLALEKVFDLVVPD
ncbi:MAG: ROK family transcriptional regulator [Armatimonadota bacterium]